MASQELVDIECRLVSGAETSKAVAVTDGTLEPDPEAPGKRKMKLYWLPRTIVEISEPDRLGKVTATMPEWLAIEKGLV